MLFENYEEGNHNWPFAHKIKASQFMCWHANTTKRKQQYNNTQPYDTL